MEEWKNLGRWIQAPLSGAFWSHWHEANSLPLILPHRFSTLVFVHGHTLVKLVDEDAVRAFVQDMATQGIWEENLAHFERVAQSSEKKHRDLLAQEFSLEEYAHALFESYRDVVGIWTIAILIGEALEEYLLTTTGASRETLMEKMIHLQQRRTWLEEETLGLKRIVEERRKGVGEAEIEKMLEEHARHYAWFGTHHWEGEAYSFQKAKAAYEELLQQSQQESSVREAPSDPVWKWIEAMTYWRTHSAEVTASVVFASRARLEEAAARLGVGYDDLVYATAAEVEQGLRDPSSFPDQQTRKMRREGGYVTWVDAEHHEYVASGAQEIAQWFERIGEGHHEEMSTLRGTVAYVGPTIEGTVCVVLVPKQDGVDFREGDILVAAETTPDYVPLMKRASAFITEVGGITSHAAIVAREMKKPCLIAVKSATHVLKTGERVFLDTTHGVVTRL